MRKPKRIFRERRKEPVNADVVDDQIQAPNETQKNRWIVLVPYMRYIEPETERKLRDVEKLGITVSRIGGCSEISWARCQMASVALLEGNTDMMFIDSDMVFNEMEVVKFFQRSEPILGGAYPQKRYGKLNVDIPSEVDKISFGTAAPPGGYKVRHIGAGFLRIKSQVLVDMINQLELPCCTFHGGQAWPFFLPFVMREFNDKWAYLGEDYAFSERLNQMGVPIIADTSVRLLHLGIYPYGWEEAANLKIERYNGLTIAHDSVERTFAKQDAARAQANGHVEPVVQEAETA